MVGNPRQGAVLEGGGTEDQRGQPHRPAGLKGHVGKEAVIAERDAQAGRDEESEKHRDLESVHPVIPQIPWYGRASDQGRANQERAVDPVDAVEGKAKFHGRDSGLPTARCEC